MEYKELASLLHSCPFRFSCEIELQNGIESLLRKRAIEFRREVILSVRDRIDFMVGTVGIEVKVDSPSSSVERQLARYAEHPEIESLLLVTNRFRHNSIAREILGKPVIVIHLIHSIF